MHTEASKSSCSSGEKGVWMGNVIYAIVGFPFIWSLEVEGFTSNDDGGGWVGALPSSRTTDRRKVPRRPDRRWCNTSRLIVETFCFESIESKFSSGTRRNLKFKEKQRLFTRWCQKEKSNQHDTCTIMRNPTSIWEVRLFPIIHNPGKQNTIKSKIRFSESVIYTVSCTWHLPWSSLSSIVCERRLKKNKSSSLGNSRK